MMSTGFTTSQLMWMVIPLAAGVAFAVWALLRARHRGDVVTRRIVESLRRESAGAEARFSGLKPTDVARILATEADVRRTIHEQDYDLLRHALKNQFILSIFVYLLSGVFVLGLTWAVLVRSERSTPSPASNWSLVSNVDEAEGHAVDTDDLLLTWKSAKTSEDAEVWLENVQTREALPTVRTSTGEQRTLIKKESYRSLLSVRERNGINRVRAVMKTAYGTFPSQEFDLHVGITIMVHTDRKDHLDVTALVDGSSEKLKQYAFKGGIVTWDSGKPEAKGGGVGFLIEEGWFKNPSARVPLTNELTVEQWQRLAFAYYEPDRPWLIRQIKRLPLEFTKDKLIK